MTAEELLAFEEEIAADFAAGCIAAPVHLAGGNERQLLQIFEQVDKEHDYIACQWRSHYHCLLMGVPKDELRTAIHKGRSIALCFPEYRVISSAIVGGIAPIAMGIAWALKRQSKPGKVWCFLGDMTYRTGIVSEVINYASGHQLPMRFIIEDNGVSVCTDTKNAWGTSYGEAVTLSTYHYALTRPHVGVGKFVRF